MVGFTKNRSVEAQSDVVGLLNDVIRQALKSCKLEDEKVILIPTGDGVAAATVASKGWDIDIRLSVAILEQVEKSNQQRLPQTIIQQNQATVSLDAKLCHSSFGCLKLSVTPTCTPVMRR